MFLSKNNCADRIADSRSQLKLSTYLRLEHEVGADVCAVVDQDLELDPDELGDRARGQLARVLQTNNL